MTMRRWVTTWVSAGLLLATLPACSEDLRIQVEENKGLNSRQYLLTQGDCKIGWRLKFFQAGKGFGIREEVDCSLSPANQIPLRRALLQKVSLDTNQMQGMRNFVWGNVPNATVFMPRLAKILRASDKWNAEKGDWRAAASVHAMRDMMNQQNVFSEVVESFSAEGWKLAVADVEKVQVTADSLAGSAGKFPSNCSIVFTVEKSALP